MLTALRGVGPKLYEKLKRLGLHTTQDMLFHLPLRYQDRTHVTPIGSLRSGREAVIIGQIKLSEVAYRGRRSLLCRVSDGTGQITLRFFYFSAKQQTELACARHIHCFGEVRIGAGGLEIVHPEYRVSDDAKTLTTETHFTPIYPTTEGVHQLTLRKLVRQALDAALPTLSEGLPELIVAQLRLVSLRQALTYVHAPPPDARLDILEQRRHPAQQRLAFEEMLAHHLSLRRRRMQVRAHSAPAIPSSCKYLKALLTQLPFPLTAAQQRVIAEINADLNQDFPMQRLLQGDVGAGKTLVAAAACLQAMEAGLQVALMAPTELLAEQHAQNFTQWLTPLGLKVARLSGKSPARPRRLLLQEVKSGEVLVVIGTHALFQEQVEFANLGLMVVDEQHRFGVDQRLALRKKGNKDGQIPHQLIMSATPIPRTLAQTLFADLDISVIDELPPGRTPIETVAIPDTRRTEVVERVRAACLQGRQAYWVCALIEESEVLLLQTATDTHLALQTALPELRINLIHGRMKAQEKEKIMAAFKDGAIDVLVATTVIEVGVDVPKASLMIIENSERLGLAQLHQLRGRVGRGAINSSCVMMYHAPLSPYARARLDCLRATNDGFEIARKDLEMRGPGELFGALQSGAPAFHIADLMRDQALLPQVMRTADLLLNDYPAQVTTIIRRWLGEAEQYGNA